MSEEDVYERVEANLLDVDTDQIKLMKKYEYISKISKIKQKTNGKLYVKQYPTGTGHVGHFRHFIKELKQKKKFVPDFIFIDYINICASSRYKSLSGVNSYSYVKAIAEELRGLAVELDVGMMTGTQVNRDGLNAKVVDMTSTSESMGLAHTLDFFMSATTDEVLSDNGQQMFKTLKTRWGNKSKLVPKVIGVNFDRMRYYEIGSFQEIQSTVNKTKPKKEEKSVITPDEVEWN